MRGKDLLRLFLVPKKTKKHMLPQRPTVNTAVPYILKTLSGPPAFMTGSTHVDEKAEEGKRKLLSTFNKDSARRFSGLYLAATLWDWWKHYTAIPVQVLLLLFTVSATAGTFTNANGSFTVTNTPADKALYAWGPSPSAGITNYNFYIGIASGQYSTVIPAGNVTNFQATLVRGSTYYAAVTAQDINGLESPFSNEVVYTPPMPPAPPNQKTPVRLTVQLKSSTEDFMWADTGMTWDVEPGAPVSFYRLAVSKTVAPPVASAIRPAITLPPLPGGN